MTELDVVRQRYRRFAETECRGYSDLYYRLALGVADREPIVRFVTARPVPQPNLFFAATQFVVGTDHMPGDAAELEALLRVRGEEIAGVMSTRRTQTNEVGRCAVIVPALPSGPLAVVEVGASAGLCLLLDEFFCDYGAGSVGPAASPVRLACTLRGSRRPRLSQPHIVWRRGLDVEPISVHDTQAARWLLACVWADHAHRRERLMAAIELARAHPPVVVQGDLVDDLRSVVADAPADARLVVLHSAVLSYVDRARRAAFESVLADMSARRDVVWISNESPGVVERLAPGVGADADGRFVVGRTTLREGTGVDEVLARAHPHGSEMTWLGRTG